MKILCAFLVCFIGVARAVLAEAPCEAPEFRQFDFWVGSWVVKNPTGKVVGTNEITRVPGGCALLERWMGGTGITGISISNYDSTDAKWHQQWMGSDGQALYLTGQISGGAMILSQEHANRRIDRVTWTPGPDGKVKQQWEASEDGGKTWKTAFVGIYEKR